MAINQVAIAQRAANRMRGYIAQGISRASSPQQIDRFLEYTIGEADPNLAFCISACCYCYAVGWLEATGTLYTPLDVPSVLNANKQEFSAEVFKPSASVTEFIRLNQDRVTMIADVPDNLTIPRGSIVMYDWGNGERHAELYDHDIPDEAGDTFATLGPNTTANGVGGQILNKVRTWQFVIALWIPK